MSRSPHPSFTAETAARKVQLAADAWNSRDPERVALASTPGSVWRNRDEFLAGRDHIAVLVQSEWRDADRQWWGNHGNELWEFADDRLMARGEASINDVEIDESDRTLFGPRS